MSLASPWWRWSVTGRRRSLSPRGRDQKKRRTVVGITGRLDVVVNNAGTSYSGPLEAFTLEQAQQQFATNVFGVWLVNHAAPPHMRRQGSGLLLHIGSIVGRIALPFLGLYGAHGMRNDSWS
jgi:NAD(P)-dependent dehydrogenase (short-subunit alcohol dehydrogenase family)